MTLPVDLKDSGQNGWTDDKRATWQHDNMTTCSWRSILGEFALFLFFNTRSSAAKISLDPSNSYRGCEAIAHLDARRVTHPTHLVTQCRNKCHTMLTMLHDPTQWQDQFLGPVVGVRHPVPNPLQPTSQSRSCPCSVEPYDPSYKHLGYSWNIRSFNDISFVITSKHSCWPTLY